MTEEGYIAILDEILQVRGASGRQDILDGLRERFADGRAAGLSDDEIIAELGSPADAADGYADGGGDYADGGGAGHAGWHADGGGGDYDGSGGHVGGYDGGYSADKRGGGQYAGGNYADAYKMPPKPARRSKTLRRILIAAFAVICVLSLAALPNTLRSMSLATHVPGGSRDGELGEGIIDRVGNLKDMEGLGALGNLGNLRALGNLGKNADAELAWGQGWSLGWGWGAAFAGKYKTLEYSQPFEGVDSVSVAGSWNLGCLFARSPDGSVHVELSGEIPEGHDVEVALDGGSLTVEYVGSQAIGFPGDRHAQAAIYLPQGWSGAAEAQTVSGGIRVDEGVSFGQFTAGTVSGDIQATGASCGSLSADTVSGGVDISGARAQRLAASTVSGSIAASLLAMPEEIELSSISGDIALRMDGDYQYSFSSVSGDLRNKSNGREGPGGFSFSTISGDVLLAMY